jgi:hypothetical protein
MYLGEAVVAKRSCIYRTTNANLRPWATAGGIAIPGRKAHRPSLPPALKAKHNVLAGQPSRQGKISDNFDYLDPSETSGLTQ